MKKNKIIIITLCIIIVIAVAGYFLLNDKTISSKNKDAIGITDITKRTYGYPCISLLSYNSSKIKVSGGIYRFGDVNQDSKINNEDGEAIKVMISYSDAFTSEQKKLADIDENGIITQNDLNMFNDYLKKNGVVTYDIGTKYLQYCAVESNNSRNCKWQDSSTLKISKNKNYYVFVRNKTNNIVSESKFFDKNVTIERPNE